MQIDFYQNFYKKRNSTKRPTVGGVGNLTEVHTVTGHLKEPCSILHPVISLQGQNPFPNNEPPDFYRYAYIPRFSRYYWVDDWTWDNGLWVVTLDVDVLATYKPHIGEQTEYILRTNSTTSDFDGAISDAMYPATTNFDIQQVGFQTPFIQNISNGIYIVGVISSDDTNAIGAITYYAMTATQFGDLKDTLFGADGLESMDLIQAGSWVATEMSEQMFKTMYNPYQYIASCIWFPVTSSDIVGTSVSTIKIGWWDFSLSGIRLSQVLGNFTDGVQVIPTHPQAATRGKYLNYSPYSKMTMYGKFGSFPIDTSYLEIGSYIVNTYSVDYVTGQCLFQTFVSETQAGTNRKLIHKTEFLIGVPIQIAQIGRDYLGMTVNAISAGQKGMTGAMMGSVAGVGGAIIGAIASAGSAIYDTINSAMPQLETSGTNGSFIENELATILISIHFVIADENLEHKGRPLCQNRRIDTLSGFILCAEGEMDLDCYDSERTEIEKFLTTGFFWE